MCYHLTGLDKIPHLRIDGSAIEYISKHQAYLLQAQWWPTLLVHLDRRGDGILEKVEDRQNHVLEIF